MAIQLPQAAKDLLDSREFAVVTTISKDGSPQSSVVWVAREGDQIVFNTAKGRAKTNNMIRDPRVSVLIYPKDDPYVYFEMRGNAELEDDPDAAMIHKLSHKYRGTDYPPLKPGEERVTVRVTPTKITRH